MVKTAGDGQQVNIPAPLFCFYGVTERSMPGGLLDFRSGYQDRVPANPYSTPLMESIQVQRKPCLTSVRHERQGTSDKEHGKIYFAMSHVSCRMSLQWRAEARHGIWQSALPRKASRANNIETVPETDTGGLVEYTKANG